MSTQKPWLKFYEPHVPERIDYPQTTLPAALAETARQYPGHAAIIFKGVQLTYQQFNEAVDRFANALQELDLAQGDRVAIHLPNCPHFPIAYYAALRAGGIAVPCNPLYQAHEMTHQLNDSGAKFIVTLSATYPLIQHIRADTQLDHIVVADLKTYLPPELEELGEAASIPPSANTHLFADMVNRPGQPKPAPITWDDTAALMYTGGTTGVPKGAQLTHKNILVNAYQCKTWVNAAAGREITLTQLPLFHIYGMTTCMNVSVLAAGAMLLILDPRDIDDVLQSIDRYRPTLYPGVPAMYIAINNRPDLDKYHLKSIKACLSGAAGLPVEVQQRFQQLTGARLVEGYGLSEASPVAIANPIFGQDRPGAIGLPWPDTDVKIVDSDTGEHSLGAGEVGELCLRGPQVMKGYWNMPSETANALRPDAEGGPPWLFTGDIAIMDEDGYFQIVDRKKDMILSTSGYNVYPREIEELVYKHPKVQEAVVVGIPSGERGERIKAYVVLKPGEAATEDEIIAFCKQNLAPYKVPRSVEFCRDLPKNTVGKVLRRLLVAEELRKRGA